MKILFKSVYMAPALVCLLLAAAVGEVDLQLHSKGWWEVGVIGNQSDTVTGGPTLNYNQSLISTPGAQFTIQAEIGDDMEGAMGIGVRQPTTPQFKVLNNQTAQSIFSSAAIGFYPYVTEARFSYFLGEKETPALKLDIGTFPFIYNKDTKNLGSYLFRGPVYPGCLIGGFQHISIDPTVANTVGAGMESNVAGLKVNLIAKSETDFRPIFDWSLGVLASYNVGGFLEVGIGANFYRLLAFNAANTDLVDPSLIQEERTLENKIFHPYMRKYIYIPYEDVTLTDADLATWRASGALPAGAPVVDAAAGDTAINLRGTNIVRVLSDDTTRLSLRGTKIMARFSLDLKPLMGMEAENEDWKIYSELALIGVKDYPGIYDKKMERIPIMFGINIPTFGILDMLNIEMEWYGAKFNNDTYKFYKFYSPIPMSGHSDEYNIINSNGKILGRADSLSYADYDPHNVTSDNIKWSLYISKTVRKHVEFTWQLASDHYRPSEWFYGNAAILSYQTPLKNPSDWYTVFKIGYFF